MADVRIARLTKELYEHQANAYKALELNLYGEDDEDMFRPGLADDLKIGFFSLDRSCQTQQTDIVDLKEMTNVLQILSHDTENIKTDLHLAKKKLESDYDNKLKAMSFDLYSRINDKLRELESMHHERVETVRRAYRQQLADALARVETLFQARFEKQMQKDKEKHKQELQRMNGEIASLTQTVQRNESVIVTLRQQLASKHKSEEAAKKWSKTKSLFNRVEIGIQCDRAEEDQEEKLNSLISSRMGAQEPAPKEDLTRVNALNKEIENLKEKLKGKDKELGQLEDELDTRNQEINDTSEKLNKVYGLYEKEQILRSQLEAELADARSQADKSSGEAKRLKQMAADLEKQRQDMEIEAEERTRKAREEAMGAGAERMREMQAEFTLKIAQLMKEKEDLERQLLKERAKNLTPVKKVEEPLTDIQKVIKSEKELRLLCEKYKKEIERINKAWGKKFAVLQSSLHALKDESYLRHHLEKQHTALHQATISYTADAPKSKIPKNYVLPNIPNRAPSPDPLASYTISRASNRFTLENQLDSEDEQADGEMVYGVLPLPEPRQRSALAHA